MDEGRRRPRHRLWATVSAILVSLLLADAVMATPPRIAVPARPAPGGGYYAPPPPGWARTVPSPRVAVTRVPTPPVRAHVPPYVLPPPVCRVVDRRVPAPSVYRGGRPLHATRSDQDAVPLPNDPLPGLPAAPLPDDPVPTAPPPGLPAAPSPAEEPIDADAPIVTPEARPIIVRIEFTGNLLYRAQSMETRMRNKVGRPLDLVALEADIAELRKFFHEINVVQVPAPGGVVLRFLVSENPLVVRLRLFGTDEMEDSELLELMRTREGFPLSRDHLAQDREDIVAAYKLRGFHFADVPEPHIVDLPGGGLRVDFIVVEGPKVEVSQMLFRGRRSVPRKDLIEAMQTRPPTFFEDIFGAPLFREEALKEDLVALKQLYRREGFLDAQVALDDLRFSDDKRKVEVTIAIDEGPCYTVGNVNVQFGRIEDDEFKEGRPHLEVGAPSAEDLAFFNDARVRGAMNLRSGVRYSGKNIEEGSQALRELYYERSFHDARILPPVVRGRERGHVVDVDLRIVEGAKFRLSRIDFIGNEATRDYVLRRDVRTGPGGFVDRNELDRGLVRLKRLGYFDRATMRLEDTMGPDGQPLPGWKSATYEVVEGSTRSINVGAQVDTNGGVGVFFTFRERNFDISRLPRSWDDVASGRAFKGAGQDFSVNISPSTRVTQFEVAFREPRLFGSMVGFDTSLYSRFSFREAYRTDRFGYHLGLSYPFVRTPDDTLRVEGSLRWRHDWFDINDIGDTAVPGAFLFAPQLEVRRLEAAVAFATLDDLKDPRWETTTRLQAEYAGGFLGGELDFHKFSASHDQLIVLHENLDGGQHRLILRGLLRYGVARDDTPELPPYERFYLGGRTLRGFEFRGVGPHVSGNPTGGEFAWSSTVEYEYPIIPKRLAIATFLDAGTVSETIDTRDARRVRLGAGLGLRLVVPILSQQPIALDFAWDLSSEPEDETSVFSFSFSRTF